MVAGPAASLPRSREEKLNFSARLSPLLNGRGQDAGEQWSAKLANQVKGGNEMKKMIVSSVFVALVVMLSTTLASAQEPIYHVRLDHVGCEDGSQECPYNTLNEAISAGYQEVCEERTFEVHVWNSDTSKYEYHDTYTGKKPIPEMGLPIAQSVLILLIALGGVFLLILALRLQRKRAK